MCSWIWIMAPKYFARIKCHSHGHRCMDKFKSPGFKYKALVHIGYILLVQHGGNARANVVLRIYRCHWERLRLCISGPRRVCANDLSFTWASANHRLESKPLLHQCNFQIFVSLRAVSGKRTPWRTQSESCWPTLREYNEDAMHKGPPGWASCK